MNMPEMKSSAQLQWSASSQQYTGKAQPGMAGTWNVFVEARQNGAVVATNRSHLSAQ
jgi:CubicO group peptidase (beta-lactamase class C family)